MRLTCQKCKKTFDPTTEMAHCHPRLGHAPCKPAAQNLTDALLENKEHVKPREKFQSDFKMIWSEPEIQIRTRR